jgi:hypothetical protein
MRFLPVLASGALIASCSTPRFDITPRYGPLDIEGDVGMSQGAVVGKADLESSGLQEDDSVLGGRFDFDWGGSHLMVSTQKSSHGGSGTMTATVSSGGNTITAGTAVDSEFDLGLHTAAYTFDFIPTDLLEVGIGLGLSYVDMFASFTEPISGETVEGDQELPIPLIAARLGTRIWRVDASLQLSGMALDIDGDSMSYFDADLMAKLRLFGGEDHLAGHLTAGYRWVDLAVDYEDDGDRVDGDVTLQGPYIGVTVSI